LRQDAGDAVARVKHSPSIYEKAEGIELMLRKGVVIDAWIIISVLGLQLITIESRVFVASFDTYKHYADSLRKTCQMTL
jgi:hypothetical protein